MTKEQMNEEMLELVKALEEAKVEIASLNKQLAETQMELANAISVREVSVNNEYNTRQNLVNLEIERDMLKKDNEELRKTLNDLANMHDEIFAAYKDLNSLLGVLKRTSDTSLNVATEKVNQFNTPKKEG